MNHFEQSNSLEEQLKRFKDFIPFCPNYALSKLMTQAHIILNRINYIKEMEVGEIMKEVPVYYETKQSKSNFKTL